MIWVRVTTCFILLGSPLFAGRNFKFNDDGDQIPIRHTQSFKKDKDSLRAVTLKKQYLEKIVHEEKTIEVRLFSSFFQDFRSGNQVKFFTGKEFAVVEIEDVRFYDSLDALLQKEPISKILPGIITVEDAKKVFSFYKPKIERQRQKGIPLKWVAYSIRLLRSNVK
jgi:ASC-1-like (ASCH) protein